MDNLKVYTGPAKLVIALDIGTTFSGISYCILEPGKVPEILGVNRFPGQELVRGDAKVPSLLYYNKQGIFRAAGEEVLAESMTQTALEEGWTKAEWWKLHLRPNHLASSIDNHDLPPLPPGKAAVDVLTDFIRYLFQCAKTYIQEHHPTLPWSWMEGSIEWICTHPNGWDSGSQQLYRLAFECAGLVPGTSEGQSRVHMLSEGEATLYFCTSTVLRGTADQADPQGIAIIDAGGGTVDLNMYSVTSNPVSCEEIAPAECQLQGSVFVTHRARALLQRKLEGWEHSSHEEILEFSREFDQSTKLIIKTDQDPAFVRVSGRRYTNPKYGIAFGKLKLSGEEATGLFKDSIDAIIEAFEQQQKYAMIPITAAFLVGGFSNNDWLYVKLQSYFKARGIELSRPHVYIKKVVPYGAVLHYVSRESGNQHSDEDNIHSKHAYSQFAELQTMVSSIKEKSRVITVLTAEVDQWKRADASKAEKLAVTQQELSVSVSRLADLDACYEAQSRELILVRDQLQKSQSRTQEVHDHKQSSELKSISASLDIEVDRWKRADAHKAEQLAIAVAQAERLQKDLSLSASKLVDLESRYETQNRELISAREELKSTTAWLTAEIDRWKRADAHKAEQLAIASKQVEGLQNDLTVSTSKLTDLETRFEAQSQELISTRDQLQKSQLRTEDLHNYYSNQLKHLKSTVKERQPQLFEVQRFVTLADEYAEGMITQMLDSLNEDIRGSTSLVAGYFVRDLQPVTEPTEEQTSALQRAGKSTGQTLVDYLQKNKSRDDMASYLTIALRAYLAYRVRWIISSWTLDKGRDRVNDALDEIYEPLQKSETSTVTGRWRSLTRAYISSSGISDLSALVPATVDGLADIVVAAGSAMSVSAVSSKLSTRFRHTISPMISAAVQLRKIVGSVVTSDFEPMAICHPQTFNATMMEVDVVDHGKGHARGTGKAMGRKVLCTTSLGLMKRVLLPESNQDTLILVKAKIALEPLVDN